MTAKIVMVTGISGSGSKEFCRSYYEEPRFGAKWLINTGGKMREYLEKVLGRAVPQENLLNLHEDTLAGARYETFKEVSDWIKNAPSDVSRVILDSHAVFLWDKVYRDAFDLRLLKEIPVDMFVTIIDKPSSIRARQLQTAQGRMQKHKLDDILSWQQNEVRDTAKMAQLLEVPHYIFSSRQKPENIESLFENEMLIYASFPMTDASAETTAQINQFKSDLRNLRKKIDGPDALEIPLIDPADIDIETGEGLAREETEAIAQHTIYRDLKWDVGKAKVTIAYYPNPETDLSAGVTHECIEAKQTGKDVYLITPRVKMSPFLEFSALQQFATKEDFMAFYEKKIVEDLARFSRE